MEKIELRPAHARDNFVACVAAELTDAEAAELRMRMGADDDGEEWKGQTPTDFIEEVGLVTHPDVATCPKCGQKFATVEPEGTMPPGFDPHRDL